jgi:hypothetical protein
MRWNVHFVVTGYADRVGQVYEVKARAGDFAVEERSISTVNPGVYPFGLSDGIDRLLNGIDLRAMRDARITIPSAEMEKVELLSYDLVIPQNLAEVVEFAEGLIGVQLLAQRFSLRAHANRQARVEGCGGQLQALSITPDGAIWHGHGTSLIADPPDPALSADSQRDAEAL